MGSFTVLPSLADLQPSTESQLESLLGAINVIISTEVDSEAKLEALAGAINLLVSTEMDSEAEIEALASIAMIVESEIDSEAEVEAIMGAVNMIVATEIDSESELEALVGSLNIILDSEIDTEGKLETLVGVAMATEAEAATAISTAVTTHTGNAGAHHAKYTDAEAIAAAKTDPKFADNVFALQDNGDATKQLVASLGGATTAKTLTLLSNHTDDRVITLPDTTGTLDTTADARDPNAHAASHQNGADALNNTVASGTDSTDRTTTTGNIVEIADCEMTLTAEAKTYRLHYTGVHQIAVVGPATMRVYYQIDAGGWVLFINSATTVAGSMHTVSANIPLTLTAGSRTIKFGFDPDAGGGATMHTEGDTTATQACITQ